MRPGDTGRCGSRTPRQAPDVVRAHRPRAPGACRESLAGGSSAPVHETSSLASARGSRVWGEVPSQGGWRRRLAGAAGRARRLRDRPVRTEARRGSPRLARPVISVAGERAPGAPRSGASCAGDHGAAKARRARELRPPARWVEGHRRRAAEANARETHHAAHRLDRRHPRSLATLRSRARGRRRGAAGVTCSRRGPTGRKGASHPG